MRHYRLYLYVPFFKTYIETNSLTALVTNSSGYDELIAQGNKEVSKRKFNGHLEGKYGYVKDLKAAREFNELLIERGDPEAIRRKLESFTLGGVEVRISLASRGYQFPTSDVRYVSEMIPLYGYVKDLKAAREFNELLVERGDPEAIKRKLEGFLGGVNGYERDPSAAKEFNDLLVEKGNPEAIKRKMIGLECGEYGYKSDLVAARKFNALFVEIGNLEAIKKKLTGLISRYKADPKAAEFVESLIVCEFPVARATGKYTKAFAMKYGVSQLGYEKAREKAIEFIKEYHVPY